MADKPVSGFKKFCNVLFNIFWAIFGGLGMAIYCISMGVITCIMIIPLFFGIPKIFFKMVPLAFAPAGKKVKLHFGKAPVRNIFYWILGGFSASLLGYLFGVLMCCTIVGIPLGLQQFKFAKYFLAPFKAEVTKNGKNLVEEKEKKSKKGEASVVASASAEKPNNTLDDLAKLKSLLDSGVITQEEFDAKKKDILGL